LIVEEDFWYGIKLPNEGKNFLTNKQNCEDYSP